MTDKVKTIDTLDKNRVQYGIFQWGPCVMHIKISEEFHKLLMKEAAASRKKELDFREKLAGIIKEEYNFINKEQFVPYISQCLGIYDEAFQKFRNVRFKPEDKPQYLLSAMWVNYMKKNEYNPPHDHGDDLSFVIFLEVPEELQKEQEKFIGNSGGPGSLGFLYGEGNRQAVTYQAVKPKDRDMFIFPAWVKHYVAPFYSDVIRISVAGNVSSSIRLNQMPQFNKQKFIHSEPQDEPKR